MQVYQHIDHYLYTLKRDIFVLQLKHRPRFDNELTLFGNFNEEAFEKHVAWFNERNIKYEMTAPMGWLSGRSGFYWVDFTSPDDPAVIAYSAEFENADGGSKDTTSYQLYLYSYADWVKDGKDKEYEQHLRDLDDPDFNW